MLSLNSGGDMQHPYINFGPIQHQHQHEQHQQHKDEATMPPALPPKRSSRSHPGSFRSDGIDIIQPAREARRLAQRAERPRRGLSAL